MLDRRPFTDVIPLAAEQHWRAEAACRNEDTNLFFPISDEGAAEAKAICAVCPVRAECLDWSIATRQSDGVWGGLTENERRRVRRRRQAAARAASAA